MTTRLYLIAAAVVAATCAHAWDTVPWPREANPAHEPGKIVYPTAFGYTDADRKRLHDVQRVISQQANSETPDTALLAVMVAERDRIMAKRTPWVEALKAELLRRCGETPSPDCTATVIDTAR